MQIGGLYKDAMHQKRIAIFSETRCSGQGFTKFISLGTNSFEYK
jgi:hypothetical protein